YDPDQPEYERVVSVSLADGTPLEMDKKYTVATNNFLAEGGDGFETFTEVDFEDSYTVVRDAVIEYLREKEEIDVDIDRRVEEVDESAMLQIRYAA
ncbi:MAG: 5'-nucleotidase C-terminal domain-containing protein, partial [Halanaerobium sp.]